MLNFLTEEEKSNLIKEYKTRRWTVFFIFIFILGLISFFLLAPTYLIVYLEKQDLVEKKEETKEVTENLEDFKTFDRLGYISNLTDLLIPHTKDIPTVDIIEMLKERKPENMNITSFAIKKDRNEDGNDDLVVSVAGQVLNREILLNFSEDLKKESYIKEVNIPLESFTQEKNLNFSLQIKGTLN